MKSNFMDVTKEISERLRGLFKTDDSNYFITHYSFGKYGMMEATHVIRGEKPFSLRTQKIAEVHHNNAPGYVPRIRIYLDNSSVGSSVDAVVSEFKEKGLEIAVERMC
ncbi:MAG: hypothetical protein WC852_02180 [Candidatus Nanoarchaeia archaeon]|jgi:hypothetical protein